MPHWIIDKAWLDKVVSLTAKIPMQQVQNGLLVVLAVWMLSMLANVFWLLMPEPDSLAVPALMQSPMRQASGQATPAATVDVAQMQGWHLFGQAQQAPEEVAQPEAAPVSQERALDAKKTQLNLILLGIMQSSNEQDSFAVIGSQGKADLFRVGQAIPIGQNITLSKVLRDRVIINNKGSLESLLLYQDKDDKVAVGQPHTASRSANDQVLDKRQDAQLSQIANRYRQQLMQNPMSLASAIRIAPAKNDSGQSIGYKISPGKDKQLFSQFGLQSGDVVTAVNGMSLADPDQAMQLYNQLRSVSQASLSITRGTEHLTILVNLSP